MPKTIIEGFKKLRQNLEITDIQELSVSKRQQNIREILETELTIINSFLTGSYRRSTMISPLSEADVDIFIILDPTYYKLNGQTYLLDKVRHILLKKYPTTPKISRNGQAVTIRFTDFKVDVVPAFHRNGGGYIIPNCVISQWISTDPRKHIEIWSNANKAHNYDLIPLIKMIKGWNKKHSKLLNSFHLESLVLKILNNIRIDSFSSGVRYVFDKARKEVINPVLDPAGYGGDIGAYLNTLNYISEVVNRLEAAYNRAIIAERLEQQGKIAEAYYQWQIIFGDYFPLYG
ncbi:CBASS oligonucleotide cyclase [Nostoc sp. DedQUE07]|uniref:CBASS oligonucleotide cyclase n=1 Tax=Nostoc sp. DedQUE07 TaxID=3075392 RepID=UPI002AD58A4E|nr:CBASS oligonucleotide cyclase [Nostoc sp. DedQUE07]MDZ8133071.1 CBASS oligonucleotide cyclase [Nostoc sp. DedQUE07]